MNELMYLFIVLSLYTCITYDPLNTSAEKLINTSNIITVNILNEIYIRANQVQQEKKQTQLQFKLNSLNKQMLDFFFFLPESWMGRVQKKEHLDYSAQY